MKVRVLFRDNTSVDITCNFWETDIDEKQQMLSLLDIYDEQSRLTASFLMSEVRGIMELPE